MTKLDGSKIKIMLDAGHGYNTAGKRTVDGSMREWEFNAEVAEIAKGMLNEYENVEVHFSHDPSGKTDIDLQKRTDYANKIMVDVFVSIHANAFGSGGWNSSDGIETYVYTTKPAGSTALATKVQKNLIAQTGRDNRGVRTANFHVLRETKMDAILVECGFMTNKEEAELLKKKDYREKCARAIVDGLVAQYGLKLKPKPKPAPKPAAKPAPAKGYFVQVGYFGNKENAENLVKQLDKKGFDAIIKPV